MAARLTLDSPVTLYCRQSAELGTRGSVQATELGLTRDQHTNSNITYTTILCLTDIDDGQTGPGHSLLRRVCVKRTWPQKIPFNIIWRVHFEWFVNSMGREAPLPSPAGRPRTTKIMEGELSGLDTRQLCKELSYVNGAITRLSQTEASPQSGLTGVKSQISI